MRHFLLRVAALALGLTLGGAPGTALADPPVGTFKIFLGDGNRIYTFSTRRNRPFHYGDVFECGRSRGGLDGHLVVRCSWRIDESNLHGVLSGPVQFFLSGDGPDKVTGVDLNLRGDLDVYGDTRPGRLKYVGSQAFSDGASLVEIRTGGKFCIRIHCKPIKPKVTFAPHPIEGLWKLKLQVNEKEPGVLSGKAEARLFLNRVRYRIHGTYDAISGTAEMTLVGKEQPRKHSISLSDVMVTDGQVSGQLQYDLYGQTGSTAFDVPLKPPAVVVEQEAP